MVEREASYTLLAGVPISKELLLGQPPEPDATKPPNLPAGRVARLSSRQSRPVWQATIRQGWFVRLLCRLSLTLPPAPSPAPLTTSSLSKHPWPTLALFHLDPAGPSLLASSPLLRWHWTACPSTSNLPYLTAFLDFPARVQPPHLYTTVELNTGEKQRDSLGDPFQPSFFYLSFFSILHLQVIHG